MCAGSHRRRARGLRSCILHLCRPCHEKLQSAPLVLQLAVKCETDAVGFDLFEVLDVMGLARTAITMSAVDAARESLTERGKR
jgi:hypothetical protein